MDQRTVDILESITDEFAAFDREWRYTYINERALHVIRRAKGEELTREDLVGKSIWEINPEAVSTVFYQKYHEAMREQKSAHFEAYSPASDRWVEVHTYPSEEGLSVYGHDISERKEAEEQCAYHASLLENIYDAVIATDEQLVVTAWNKGAEEMYGWKADEVLGLSLWEAVPVDLSEEQRARALRELAEKGRLRTEATTYAKDNTPVYVEGITIALRGEQGEGEITGYVNIRRDISERKSAEEWVEESRKAERSRIARDLHDEPLQELTDALVQTQQIHSFSKDPPQTQRLVRLLATLDRIGPQLRGAIYDLRLDGEYDKHFPELLEALVELHREMAPESTIVYQVHDGVLSGPLGESGRQLMRILGEALTNVRRHSGAQNVRVGVGITEGKLWAEVKDNGRGFDAAAYSEEALSSSGVGIRGMRERARALGGDLKIESDPQSGTRVRFEMILKKGEEEPEEERVHVLLVEDHASIREALASSFEGEGFEVVGQAGSMAQARGILKDTEHPIDVSLIDLGLPDGYGADLIKELREAHPQAQTLVLSASLDRTNVALAVERGAAGVLSKTAHLEEIVQAVRRLRAGQTLMPLEEVVELLRYSSTRREEEHEARQAIERLTPREIEVLQALAEGLDSEGIAERLNIALRTERNHMASILKKLEVHSQLQALLFALRHGVVEIS
jgi:PAS domain S-box-containing protein